MWDLKHIVVNLTVHKLRLFVTQNIESYVGMAVRRGRLRRGLFLVFLAAPWPQMFVYRLESSPISRRANIIRIGNTSLAAVFSPCFLLATEITLDPRDGDERPDAGPNEW